MFEATLTASTMAVPIAGLGALLLGVVQGLTEFLPVSSSGHLVVFQQILPPEGDEVLFDLVLHVATLLPAMWFFRADLRQMLVDPVRGEGPLWQRPGVRLAALVLVATVPTGLIGVIGKEMFESWFERLDIVAAAFVVTGTLLFLTRRLSDGYRGLMDVPLGYAALIGTVQGLAITPGISRSGSTIAVALLLGLRRDVAVRLSFLMCIPAILGAVLLKLREVESSGLEPTELGIGFVAAMLSGYAALAWLVALVKRGRFGDFSFYVWAMAVVAAVMAVFA